MSTKQWQSTCLKSDVISNLLFMKIENCNTENLVSVVIPCFNSESFIRECIYSVLGQTYDEIEVIVVDDGSTDGTLKILEEFSKSITVLKQENHGAASARNRGIKQSRGRFIALLDSDDIWKPDKLEKQMDIMRNSNFDLVYCGGESMGQAGPPRRYVPSFSGNCYQHFVENPTKAIVILGCSSAVFRKSILDQSGYFNEDFMGAAEDWDFFRRYSRHGEFGFSEEILMKYRFHYNSISNRNLSDFCFGNFRAIVRMFDEDRAITTTRRTIIFMKFGLIILKSAIKKHKNIESNH